MTTAIGSSLDLQALKARYPLAEVVQASGVRLRGRGRVRQGPCLFHKETEPSFTVYQDTQRFYCFGCGAMGDVLDFLQFIHRVDLPDAVRLLDGTPPMAPLAPATPRSAPLVPAQSSTRDTAVLAAAARFYAAALRHSSEACDYLGRRRIRLETAASLGLGYAPGTGLRAYLEQAGFDAGAIAGSGLLLDEHERFAGRIVVPDIRSGRVTWLTGRSIGVAEPRFQALPGAKPLLGRARLGNARMVVLTEGLFDWLVLMQWGLPASATLGSRGLDRVAAALAGCTRIYVVMDADEAGREATEQITALLGSRAVPVSLPYGVKDVADLALHPRGQPLFLRLLTQAKRGIALESTT